MSTLKELNLRITSLASTRKITQAMKLIATTKLNKFQAKIRFNNSYYHHLNSVFRKVLGYIHNHQDSIEDNPLWSASRGNRVRILLFTSDRGLCGSFNSSVVKLAHQVATQFVEQGKEITFDCYGKKGYDFFSRRGFPIEAKYEPTFKETYEEAPTQKFAQYYLEKFQEGAFDELYLIYNSYISAISQKPYMTQILPFKLEQEPGFRDGKSQEQSSDTVEPPFVGLFEPDLATFLKYLISKFVQFAFYFAFLNSATGEHAARMTSMDSATKNSTDMIDRLTLERNRVRQAAITKELIEIISGAESV